MMRACKAADSAEGRVVAVNSEARVAADLEAVAPDVL